MGKDLALLEGRIKHSKRPVIQKPIESAPPNKEQEINSFCDGELNQPEPQEEEEEEDTLPPMV